MKNVNPKEIKQYCNLHYPNDAYPFEVVRVISEKTVEIREMDSELTKAPSDFTPGGFVGHFHDNYAQEWKYTSNDSNRIIRVRWSERNKRWQDRGGSRYIMNDQPRRFYDYNL